MDGSTDWQTGIRDGDSLEMQADRGRKTETKMSPAISVFRLI